MRALCHRASARANARACSTIGIISRVPSGPATSAAALHPNRCVSNVLQPGILAAFLSLAAMEIVLGIDNLVFIAILVARVPAPRRELVRRIGVGVALV